MQSFIYLPLTNDPVEIRLVILLPSNDNEDGDIICRITRFPLDTNIEYEALSYVWGSSEELRPIQVMGSADCGETSVDKREFLVTPNLHDALRLLRRKDGQCKVLWVDALCIDQSNDQERSSQVGLMRSIYSKARQTIVYFGPEDEFSAVGMEFIERVATTVYMDRLPKSGVWRDTKKIEGHPVREILKGLNAVEAVVQLYIRPWWTRVWIVQEISVAKKAVFHWGQKSLPWECCARTIFALHNYMGHIRETPEFDESEAWHIIGDRNLLAYNVINTSVTYRSEHEWSLTPLLQQFWLSEATDSRDKVYALLGLETCNPPSFIVPDYSLHPGQVYGMVVKDSMLRAKNLNILALCSGPGARRQDSLPTWAPDWTSEGRQSKYKPGYHTFPFHTFPLNRSVLSDQEPSAFRKFNASGEYSIENVYFSDDYRELFLTGRCVDTISELSEVREYRYIKYSVFEDWGALGDKLSEYPTGEYVPLVFWKTLCADQYEMYENILLGNMDDHQACVSAVTSGRKFMLTEKGFMGLAVIEAKKGDSICVIEGSRVPVILRKEDDHYLMVGEAYVHGIMYGEAYGDTEAAYHRMEFRIL